MRIHPTFHVSRVKPYIMPRLGPAPGPPPPARLLDGGPSIRSAASSGPGGGAVGSIIWSIGRGKVLRSGPGFRPASMWTRLSSESSTTSILPSLGVRLEPDVEEGVVL
ncbi:hypothetical protein AMECASPLE_037247 [Ameca splendens]|uniref:Uncharacterized protein n=1 Tax=Ameca splendens TaxID=208324 RepID=A0ABV1A391_9TELE